MLENQKEEVLGRLQESYEGRRSKLEDLAAKLEDNFVVLNETELLIKTLLGMPSHPSHLLLKQELVARVGEHASACVDLRDVERLVTRLHFEADKGGIKRAVDEAYGVVEGCDDWVVEEGARNGDLENESQAVMFTQAQRKNPREQLKRSVMHSLSSSQHHECSVNSDNRCPCSVWCFFGVCAKVQLNSFQFFSKKSFQLEQKNIQNLPQPSLLIV